MRTLILLIFVNLCAPLYAQVSIAIDVNKDVKAISGAIYGRNNFFPKESYAPALSAAELLQARESGIQMLREGGGNNATKYNWRKRLSSHPDWYNNVYGNDWDKSVKMLRDSLPNAVKGMWSLQLIGKSAATNTANFNDWGYNGSQWWTGTAQNLAGGGKVNTAGGDKALSNGDPNQYLQPCTADSTVGILDHWVNSLKIPKARINYWNMDNEPEIWHSSHDDIVSSNLQAETFMQTYFAVAKKARAKFPDIKLVGPVTANEWQWYNWMNKITGADGKYYPWLEFFIKRCAEEQKASGIKMLDVLDIHFYPTESSPEQVVQLHHVFFDKSYNYPGANGIKSISGGWDASQSKEYIFGRANDWLTQYFGANHDIKLGLTEMDVNNNTPSVVSVWYASMMGEFMKNDVAIFTPWSWKTGMWETVHLFARYNKTQSVQGISSDENLVSAYPSVNNAKDSMTVVLVNRSTSAVKYTTLNFNKFIVENSAADVLQLAALPNNETFVSHKQNALQKSTVYFANNSVALGLPPLSVTSLSFKGKSLADSAAEQIQFVLSPNPTSGIFEIKNLENIENISIFDTNGRLTQQFDTPNSMTFDISNVPNGAYQVVIRAQGQVFVKELMKM
jgi:hypothetical protein